MGSGLARILAALAALCGGIVAAAAAECPGNANALGTSRTIVVDPREHARIGLMDYAETLPLADKEVVLTFDDGPIPPHSTRILDILAAECVRATYFIVGEMAREYPAVVRRAYDEGHTIGTHSMNHPLRFRAQSVDRGNAQIDDGIAATAAALGGADKVAPFFRFPGFGHTTAGHEHAAERGLQVWGADFSGDDWHKIGGREVARRALQRLEAKGKGMILLHDIHARTVEALPIILEELKARGYRIVHIVPASAERPATITTANAWRPNAQRERAAPVILLASVQEPDVGALVTKSDAELCAVSVMAQKPSFRMTVEKHLAVEKHQPTAKMANRHRPPVSRAARVASADAARPSPEPTVGFDRHAAAQ